LGTVAKKLLMVIQPPKPISTMTEEELHEFAQSVVDRTREQIEPTPSS
jgi:hypothetical protein